MEQFDLNRTQFRSKGMIPSVGDDVTTHWGRGLVHNTLNGYGMIGTVRLDTQDILWFNLGLSRRFNYPPEVSLLYKRSDNNTLYSNESLYAKYTVNSVNGVRYTEIEYIRAISYYLTGDLIGFRANWSGLFSPEPDYYDVFYKIHGC